MTGKSAPAPRPSLAPALLLAALAVVLLGGCFASRAPVPTQDQRVTEAEGRKARLEREAAETAPQPAKPAPRAEAKAEAKVAAKPEAKTETPDAAPVSAPGAETKPEAPKDTAQAKPAEAAPVAAKAEAAPIAKAEPAPVVAEPAPALNAEQLPAKELTLQGQYVQIASFGTEKNAQNAVAWLAANGYPSSRVVRVEQGGNALHRVQAGPFQDPAAARGALDALKAQWPQAFIPVD